jgi:formylglycine-generating enzyme required for sulfatase activity
VQQIKDRETFRIESPDAGQEGQAVAWGGAVFFRAANGRYVRFDRDGGLGLAADALRPLEWETFWFRPVDPIPPPPEERVVDRPLPGPDEVARRENLRRWQASGEPRFWVHTREARWGEDELNSLLGPLERSAFWPLERASVVGLLEELRCNWRPAGECFTNASGMTFAWVPPGTFVMGSPEDEAGRDPDELRHPVTLTRGFWMGVTQVTQEQFQNVLGYNPSHFRGGDLPVETVHWENACDFCRRLSDREGRCYRLPTEAEWEYACRAGTQTAYWFGNESHGPNPFIRFIRLFGPDILARHAWYRGNSGGRPHPCGLLLPNPWGLFDVHGNVWEWCQDWYDLNYYRQTPLVDPPGPESGTRHVLRGGSWNNRAIRLRSARRPWLPPEHPDRYGFRVVLDSDDRWGRND